ncbi:hypothetical protein ACFXAW_13240 [Streptomyces sp. NPDC059445]|uniref:SCO2400 family protein n=1 Tax=Streptomyces sp. NPDC059445 TaxID=3346832 RepID=UPI0036A802CC
MDYCHVCRRHLNGALACPGCGTPVDELGADAEDAGARPPADADTDAHHGDDGGDRDIEWRSRRAARRRGPVVDTEAGSEGDPRGARGPAGASRRDRKAAAHRRRRRRTLYIAVGFVLAAGGLSLAELGVDAPGLGPSPAAAESPDGSASPAASVLKKGSPSKSPSAGRTSTSSPSASGSASASSSASATSEKSAGSGGSATAGTLPGRSTSAPAATPAAPGTSAPATTGPTTSAPTPAPSSSGDCNRFLWWCT